MSGNHMNARSLSLYQRPLLEFKATGSHTLANARHCPPKRRNALRRAVEIPQIEYVDRHVHIPIQKASHDLRLSAPEGYCLEIL